MRELDFQLEPGVTRSFQERPSRNSSRNSRGSSLAKHGKKIRPSKSLVPSKPFAMAAPYASVSMRHIGLRARYCLSLCDRNEVAAALDCLRKMCSLSWPQIGVHSGLRLKKADENELPMQRPSFLDEGLTISYVRASDRFRIFGFRVGEVFHVLWFDSEHTIYPGG